MNLRIALKPEQGYNKIFDVGEYGMKLTKFGLLKLAKGTSYDGDTGETEVALVLVGGNFTTYDGVTANGMARLSATGARDTTFATGKSAGKSHCPAAAECPHAESSCGCGCGCGGHHHH